MFSTAFPRSFQHIFYQERSLNIKSHLDWILGMLSFERWEEVFKDPTLTGALIDRLAHKAHVLDISRDKSGRFEETIAWLDSKRQLV